MSPSKFAAVVPLSSAGKRRLRKARATLELSPAVEAYRGDREGALRLLNEALATEIVGLLRYRRHHFMARSLGRHRIADEFLVHADEELSHADLIADRIVRLGGEPDFAPDTLMERSHSHYRATASVVEMIRENLAAKQVAIDSYRRLVEFIGENDPTTRRMLEGILGVEEAHAGELRELLQGRP